MKKSKAVSLLLSLSMIASLVMPSTLMMPTYAADTPKDSGMKVLKTAEPAKDEEGAYTIKLEAYATGSTVMTEVKKVKPADIILVLDQSGSMTDSRMSTYSFRRYTRKSNEDYYELRYNGGEKNLYYQLDDGGYVSVSVNKILSSDENLFNECQTNWNNGTYYENRDNLYVATNEGYGKVEVERTGRKYNYNYNYKFPDGSEFPSQYEWNSPGNFNDKGPLFTYSGDVTYRYSYKENGELHVLEDSIGQSAEPNITLYEKYKNGGSITRLQALKNAVTKFADSVREKAAGADGEWGTTDDVYHRVAVVGFATGEKSHFRGYPAWQNTELFVGSKQYNYNGDQNANANQNGKAEQYYTKALQDMRDAREYQNILDSKDSLEGIGETYPNYGLKMANGIFKADQLKGDRKKVVVLFTDGAPGKDGNYDSDVASPTLTEAQQLKDDDVTIYTVGVFDGADATSAGNANGNNTQKANWFMQNVSSNNGEVKEDGGYYLSAADPDTLNDIFTKISTWLPTGGTTTKLTSDSIVKDIISEQFTLPEGADADDITLETYECTGKNAKGEYTWKKNPDAMGAHVITPVERDQVSVSGFNFSENYVGTFTDKNGNVTYRGNKLVIKFNVKPKEGMLGGNQVYTNAGAGIYEDASAEEPVVRFNEPTVDVPIPEIKVTAEDKNVYLKGGVTAEELKNGLTIKAGKTDIELGKDNYGLKKWQNAYVETTVEITDADGNVKVRITDDENAKEVKEDISGLTDDTTYSVKVTISPKYTGSVTAKDGTGNAKIKVFKPELTYKDSSAYYGETVATEFSSNWVSENWKHGDTKDDEVTMLGEKPKLKLGYEPDTKMLDDGKYTKKDVPVKVTVNIGEEDVTNKTTFEHKKCTGNECKWDESIKTGDPAFLIHIKTCQLTITKTGGADGEPYVFTVKKDGKPYSEVTIVGTDSKTIYELPVGSYTIEEDTGWSWRYSPIPTYNPNDVTLSSTSTSGELKCENTKKKDKWLNGFSNVVTNIFGEPHTQKGGEN